MKLNILPARTGLTWVKLGIQTFWRQPLAMSGLFFMFMALISVASMVPYVGSALALAVLPSATLGLMAATREVTLDRFPMPMILFTAFRAGAKTVRAMLLLGLVYAASFLAIMALSTLFDGGTFAQLYLMGGEVTEEVVKQPGFQRAMWISTLLYLPLSMLFWHAPALVYWYGVPPVKSLFFSLVACSRNFGAWLVYSLAWAGLFVLSALVVMVLVNLLGNAEWAALALMPMALVLAAMFLTSVYFTVRDSFLTPESETP